MAGESIEGFSEKVADELRRTQRDELSKKDGRIRKLQREVSALTKDRDDLLGSLEDLRALTYPPPASTNPANRRRKRDRLRVIIPDVHGSQMDRSAILALLADVRTLCPDEIVIMGDLVECGGFLAKHHVLGYVAQTAYTYEDDLAQGNWFLDELAKAAPSASIIWIEGNHEDRVERWCVDVAISNGREAEFLRRAFSPEFLLKAKERGIPYYRRSVIHNVTGFPGWLKIGKCFFVHELAGGKNAAMASLSATAGNLWYAHTHTEATATLNLPGIGLVKASNPGCLCLTQPLWRHTPPTNWSLGYGTQFISKNENFLNLNVPIIDGASMLRNALR
jgi:hypothetical protein